MVFQEIHQGQPEIHVTAARRRFVGLVGGIAAVYNWGDRFL